jgi:hypothetical protein
MSYVPSHQGSITCAQPQALTLIEHTGSTGQALTVGNRVNIGTIHNLFGAFSPTISTNQITLESGYYYVEMCESAQREQAMELAECKAKRAGGAVLDCEKRIKDAVDKALKNHKDIVCDD